MISPGRPVTIIVKPQHYGFLVVPNFPLVPYSAAIETLRMANQISKRKLYSWETISIDGSTVSARCGLKVIPNNSVQSNSEFEAVFVCGGLHIRSAWSTKLGEWLRLLDRKKIALGSLSTGSYLLARAGVLDGYRCAIHWDRLAATREDFPQLVITDAIFEIDRGRYTCAGGTAAIDMMVQLIAQEHGEQLAIDICDLLIVDRMRYTHDRQHIPLQHEVGTSQPKLTEAAKLMAANIEEPLSPDELAGYVSISRRQLERLFRAHLACTPTQYYSKLRLNEARRLLMQTEKSILQVSISCGFASAAHFSKCYREAFGLPPRTDRQRLSARDREQKYQAPGKAG